MISPLVARTAEPTRNFEYGAYAFSIAAKATSLSCSLSVLLSVTFAPCRKETTHRHRDMRHQATVPPLRRDQKMFFECQDRRVLLPARARAEALSLSHDPSTA